MASQISVNFGPAHKFTLLLHNLEQLRMHNTLSDDDRNYLQHCKDCFHERRAILPQQTVKSISENITRINQINVNNLKKTLRAFSKDRFLHKSFCFVFSTCNINPFSTVENHLRKAFFLQSSITRNIGDFPE